MPRKMLTLVLALPMLLPPGVCICRGGCTHSNSPSTHTHPGEENTPPETSPCDCHHEDDQAPAGDQHDDGVPGTPEDDHAPGCPEWKAPASVVKPVKIDHVVSPLSCAVSPVLFSPIKVRAFSAVAWDHAP